MSTEEWGWKSCEGLLVPVITHLHLQHLKYFFTLSGLTVPQTAAASGALAERTTSIVHPLAVNAEAQLAQTLHNQMNLTAVVKITMIHDFCVFTIHEK